MNVFSAIWPERLRELLDFLRSCLAVLSSRWKIIVIFNLLFFACLLASFIGVAFVLPQTPWYEQPVQQKLAVNVDWLSKFLDIFFHNLRISSTLVTLPGVIFFPLSMAAPLYNAALWGAIIYPLGDAQFLYLLPTLILEAEAIILAATAGTVLGCAWLKPNWIHPNLDMSRRASFWVAFHDEALRIYVFVVLLLLIAAIVETATIFLAT